MKKISVVIPTFNREHLIKYTLKALVNQTIDRDHYEIIVVDNNSTDNTKVIVSEFCKKYPDCFFYVLQKKKGVAASRNLGFKRACADIVIFLDDDMFADKALIEEHIKAHKVFKGSVLGYFEMQLKGEKDLFKEYLIKSGNQNGFPFEDNEEIDYSHFYTGNVSVRRDVFEYVGGFDEEFKLYGFEDIDLGYRLSAYGEKCFFCKKALSFHAYYPDYNSFLEKIKKSGFSLGYFLDKYPDIDGRFNFGPGYFLTRGPVILFFRFIKPFLFFKKCNSLNWLQYNYFRLTIRWAMYTGFLEYKKNRRLLSADRSQMCK